MTLNEGDIRWMVSSSVRAILVEWGKREPRPPYSDDDPIELVKDPNVVDGGNFPIRRNGVEFWVSPSNVVSLVVLCKDSAGRWCALASKRGPGAKVAKGKWNVVAGFLDYGYSLEETAVKECFEETGVKINKNQLINDGTSVFKKNSVVKTFFSCVLNGSTDQYPTSIGNCEPGEVVEAKWIPLDELGKYNWMSDHAQRIMSAAERLIPNDDGSANEGIFKTVIKGIQSLVIGGYLSKEKYNAIMNILKS